MDFQKKIKKSTFFLRQNVPNFHKPFVVSFRPDRLSRFDIYWIHTDRQAKYLFKSN